MSEDWLTIQETADVLGLAYRTVFLMVRRGELPAEKVNTAPGHPYRIRRAER